MTLLPAQKKTICLAALLGFSAVLLGAFGAHGLKSRMTAEMLAVFQVGCHYHLAHALALLALAGSAPMIQQKTLCWVYRCWGFGVVVFSGSLYVLAITGFRRWGMITPIGGLLLMAGWLILFFGVIRQTAPEKTNS